MHSPSALTLLLGRIGRSSGCRGLCWRETRVTMRFINFESLGMTWCSKCEIALKTVRCFCCHNKGRIKARGRKRLTSPNTRFVETEAEPFSELIKINTTTTTTTSGPSAIQVARQVQWQRQREQERDGEEQQRRDNPDPRGTPYVAPARAVGEIEAKADLPTSMPLRQIPLLPRIQKGSD
jgi:hypothetical protein